MSATRKAFRLTGWHVLGAFVVFFGITAAVNALMVVDAYSTFSGEVSSTPYEDGLAYDSELGQQRAQAALGWRMSAGVIAPDAVRLTASDQAGAPVSGLRIVARLERPATEAGRRDLKFREVAPGDYEARPGAIVGAWDLRLSAYDAKGRRFDAERRLVAP
ncbi:MAG: FixH family protein [Caulobacterales bacterium]